MKLTLFQCIHSLVVLSFTLLIQILYDSTRVDAFAVPKTEFLLEIDGNGITTSREHICAIEQKQGSSMGGRAKCWGDDHLGRLDAPLDIEFVQITSGMFFSCGISIDQTVHCWGHIESIVPGLYTQITADGDGRFACGLLLDGTINCWGSMDEHLSRVPVHTSKFLQLSCSTNHCCAIDNRGYPYCWGVQLKGPHLYPPTISYAEYQDSKSTFGWIIKKEVDEYEGEDEENEQSLVTEGELSNDGTIEQVSTVQFRQISVALDISCGITLLGAHLQCWGNDILFKRKGFPARVQGPFRQVSVGELGVCAIVAEPDEISGDEDILRVNSSLNNTMVPDTLLCWGMAARQFNTQKFSAWDQVKVGSTLICGVSMNSELECVGSHLPANMHHIHQSLTIA